MAYLKIGLFEKTRKDFEIGVFEEVTKHKKGPPSHSYPCPHPRHARGRSWKGDMLEIRLEPCNEAIGGGGGDK